MTEANTSPAASAPPSGTAASQSPPTAPPPWWPPAAPPRKSRLRKTLTYVGVLVLVLSLIINAYLVVILAALSESTMSESLLQDGAEDQVVAVYEIEGLIDGDTASDFSRFFRILRDRDDIKAVVVRVDSPGGYPAASDQISMLMRRIGQERNLPVVVSMGGVAASGGYYVSAPARIIFAEPTTITASIGVIMQFPVVHDWLEKHGLKVVTIRSSQSERFKAAINYFENPDPVILRERQKLLDTVHRKFVQVVRDGRGKKVKTEAISVKVKDLDGKEVTHEQTYPFNGQVLTASAAVDAGLVDRIGYLDDAVQAAAKEAKLDDPRVVRLFKTKGLLGRILSSAKIETPTGIEERLVRRYLSPRPMVIWEGQ